MSTLSKFWKIILSYKWGIILSFAVTVGLTLLFGFFLGEEANSEGEFQPLTNINVAIFDRDDTSLTNSFINFLDDKHQITEIEDNMDEWLEVTTWNVTALVIEIPEGFTESFITGDNIVQIEFLHNENSVEGHLLQGQIERYFSALGVYIAGGFDIGSASQLSADIFENGVEVQMKVVQENYFMDEYFFFRFMPVSLLLVIAVATGGVFLALKKQDISRRIESAPVSYRRRTLERIGSCLTFGLLSWFVFVTTAVVMFGQTMFEVENLIRLFNSLPLVLLGISIAYVMMLFVEKREMIMSFVIIVVMSLAMPAGILFELDMMGVQVLRVARFTPLYWYSRVNDMILFEGINLDWALIIQSFAIQIAFAAAILAVGMVIGKERRKG